MRAGGSGPGCLDRHLAAVRKESDRPTGAVVVVQNSRTTRPRPCRSRIGVGTYQSEATNCRRFVARRWSFASRANVSGGRWTQSESLRPPRQPVRRSGVVRRSCAMGIAGMSLRRTYGRVMAMPYVSAATTISSATVFHDRPRSMDGEASRRSSRDHTRFCQGNGRGFYKQSSLLRTRRARPCHTSYLPEPSGTCPGLGGRVTRR